MVRIKVVYGILEHRLEASDVPRRGSVTITSLWEHPEDTHLGSSGPLEASRGQTKQAMVGIKVVSGILEQVESAQRAHK